MSILRPFKFANSNKNSGAIQQFLVSDEDYLAYKTGKYLSDLVEGDPGTLTLTSSGTTLDVGTYVDTVYNPSEPSAGPVNYTRTYNVTAVTNLNNNTNTLSFINPVNVPTLVFTDDTLEITITIDASSINGNGYEEIQTSIAFTPGALNYTVDSIVTTPTANVLNGNTVSWENFSQANPDGQYTAVYSISFSDLTYTEIILSCAVLDTDNETSTAGDAFETFIRAERSDSPGLSEIETSVYQINDTIVPAESGPDQQYPVFYDGYRRGIKEMNDAELDLMCERVVSNVIEKEMPGTYRLSAETPGDDWESYLENVFVDTRYDGTFVTYTIWKRIEDTIPYPYKPLRVKRVDSSFAGLQEMTSDQISFTFGERSKRIMNETGIGQYQLRSSEQGPPTDPGVWIERGVALDTRTTLFAEEGYEGEVVYEKAYTATYTPDISYEVEYIGTYTADYTGDFLGQYTGEYTSEFLGEFTDEYIGEFIDEFLGEYTGEYISEFLGEFTDEYIGEFTGQFIDEYTGEFTDEYIGEFTDEYSGQFLSEFVDSYSGQFVDYSGYVGQYTGEFVDYSGYIGQFTDEYVSQFVDYSGYVGQYTGEFVDYSGYIGQFTDEYVGQFVDYSGYIGQFIDEYVGQFVDYSGYIGQFTDQFVDYSGYLSEFIDEYSGQFTGQFVDYSGYIGDFVDEYTGQFVDYSGYIGDFVDEYIGQFTGEYAGEADYRISTFDERVESYQGFLLTTDFGTGFATEFGTGFATDFGTAENFIGYDGPQNYAGPPASYTISFLNTSNTPITTIQEGGTIRLALGVTNSIGEQVSWAITGDSQGRLASSSGDFTTPYNSQDVVINVDTGFVGPEVFTITVTGDVSGATAQDTITVTEAAAVRTNVINMVATTVTEGDSYSFDITQTLQNTATYADFDYEITGDTRANVALTTITAAAFASGSGTVTINPTTTSDDIYQGPQTITISGTGTSDTFSLVDEAPSYGAFSVSPTSIDEDGTVAEFELLATNVESGVTVDWTSNATGGVEYIGPDLQISYTSAVAGFADLTQNFGTITRAGDGNFRFWVRAIADLAVDNENPEDFIVTIAANDSNATATGGPSATLEVNDTSIPANAPTVTPNTTSPTEGDTVTFTFGEAAGSAAQTYYFDITHGTTSNADFTADPPGNGATARTTVTWNGSVFSPTSVAVTLAGAGGADGVDDNETFTGKLFDAVTAGSEVATTATITVADDPAATASISFDPTTINFGHENMNGGGTVFQDINLFRNGDATIVKAAIPSGTESTNVETPAIDTSGANTNWSDQQGTNFGDNYQIQVNCYVNSSKTTRLTSTTRSGDGQGNFGSYDTVFLYKGSTLLNGNEAGVTNVQWEQDDATPAWFQMNDDIKISTASSVQGVVPGGNKTTSQPGYIEFIIKEYSGTLGTGTTVLTAGHDFLVAAKNF